MHSVPVHHLAEIIRVVTHAAVTYHDPLVRVTRSLEWLSSHLKGIGATLTLLRQPDGPGSVQLLKMADIGTWGPVERAARDAYFRDPEHTSDPFAACMCERDFSAGPTAAIREDCLSDEEWYSSPHVMNFRQRAQMDSAIYAIIPVEAGEGKAAKIFGLSINKRWGEPSFRPEQRDFALHFLLGLSPFLAEVWNEDSESLDATLASLPLRHRKVLSCLLAGRSERETADELMLSNQTVHTYVKEIYLHFGVNRRAQLLAKLSKLS